jgi:hypothetical protein
LRRRARRTPSAAIPTSTSLHARTARVGYAPSRRRAPTDRRSRAHRCIAAASGRSGRSHRTGSRPSTSKARSPRPPAAARLSCCQTRGTGAAGQCVVKARPSASPVRAAGAHRVRNRWVKIFGLGSVELAALVVFTVDCLLAGRRDIGWADSHAFADATPVSKLLGEWAALGFFAGAGPRRAGRQHRKDEQQEACAGRGRHHADPTRAQKQAADSLFGNDVSTRFNAHPAPIRIAFGGTTVEASTDFITRSENVAAVRGRLISVGAPARQLAIDGPPIQHSWG